jgi:hypothetical protein
MIHELFVFEERKPSQGSNVSNHLGAYDRKIRSGNVPG